MGWTLDLMCGGGVSSKPAQPIAYYLLPTDQMVMDGGRTSEHWALVLMGSFAQLQDLVAVMVDMILGQSTPALAKKLAKKHLHRLDDEARWDT